MRSTPFNAEPCSQFHSAKVVIDDISSGTCEISLVRASLPSASSGTRGPKYTFLPFAASTPTSGGAGGGTWS